MRRELRLKTCSAMAATAMRTLPNVKSSAMMPRQPEVPNFMGEAAIGFGRAVLYLGAAMHSSTVRLTEAKS